MYFIGIDLAWSPKNNSAAAAINAERGQGELLANYSKTLDTDVKIVKFISEICKGEAAIIGIDAPLIVPNEKRQRPCDREITKVFSSYHAGTYPANQNILKGYNSGKVRGVELLKSLEVISFSRDPHILRQNKQERRVIEVYPHPATITLFDLKKVLKYKARKGRKIKDRQRELASLQGYIKELGKAKPSLNQCEQYLCPTEQLHGRNFKAHEDFLDAILCAYIVYHAWYWGNAGEHAYKIFGEPEIEKGYIMVPNYKSWLSSRA